MDLSKKLDLIFENKSTNDDVFILSEATPERPGWAGKGSMPLLGGESPKKGQGRQDFGGLEGWTRWENAANALQKGQEAVKASLENPDLSDEDRSKLDQVVERMSAAAGQLARQGKLTPDMAKASMDSFSQLAQSGISKASPALQKAMVNMKNHAGDAGVPAEEMGEYNKVSDQYAQRVEKEAGTEQASEPEQEAEQTKEPEQDPDLADEEPADRPEADYEGETDQPDPRTTGPEKPTDEPLDPYGDEEDEFVPPDKSEIGQDRQDVADAMDEPDVLDPYAGEGEEDDNTLGTDEDEEEDKPLELADEPEPSEKEADWENDPRVADVAKNMDDDEGPPDILDPYAGEGESDDNTLGDEPEDEKEPEPELGLADEKPSDRSETDWENDPRVADVAKNMDDDGEPLELAPETERPARKYYDDETGEALDPRLAGTEDWDEPESGPTDEAEPEASPQAEPAPQTPQTPPAPQAAPAPQAPPAPQAAPAPQAPQAAPAPQTPQAAPAPQTPQAAPAPQTPQAAPAPQAPQTAPAPQAPQTPQTPQTPQAQAPYNPGANNVSIVQQLGDNALVRLRGGDGKGGAVYKYFTVNGDALKDITGDASLDPGNIWNYAWTNYQKNPQQFRRQFVASADQAMSRLQQTAGEEPPNSVDEYIRRAVGKTHKEMLLNAVKRTGKNDLMDIVSGLSDDQVAKLLEEYPSVRNAQIPDAQVQEYMKTLERRFSPQMESKGYEDLLLEVGFMKRLGGKLKRGLRGVQSKLGLDTELYAKQALRYDMLVQAMSQDPQRMAQALQKVGVDISKFPQLSGMQPTSEKEALGKPEKSAENKPHAGVLNPYAGEGESDENTVGDPNDDETEGTAQNPQDRALQQAQRTEPTTTQQDVQQASTAVQQQQAKPNLRQRMARGARNLMSKGLQKASEWVKPKSEEYARAIYNDLTIEEARLDANQYAQAALKLYVIRCNELNRSEISEMFDDQRQLLFSEAFQNAQKAFRAYSERLKRSGLEPAPASEGGLYESLIHLAYCTIDPLSENGQALLGQHPALIAEEYHQQCIGVKENKGDYIPLSNIL